MGLNYGDVLSLVLIAVLMLSITTISEVDSFVGVTNEEVTVLGSEFIPAHNQTVGFPFFAETIAIPDFYKTELEYNGSKLISGDRDIFDKARKNVGSKIIVKVAKIQERADTVVFRVRLDYKYSIVGLA